MKKSNLTLHLAVVALTPLAAAAETVYDNSVNDPEIRFQTGTARVGDEINLGGSLRVLDTFSFEYFYTNTPSWSESPSVQVTLYANDGPDFNAEATPGTVLWSSPTYGGLLVSYTARSTINFNQADFGSSVVLPDTFTWTVQFGNLAAGDEIGFDIYDPPVVGSSEPDYWINTGSGWELKEDIVDPVLNPVNFAAVFTTVPEPTTFTLALLGGLGLAARRRRG